MATMPSARIDQLRCRAAPLEMTEDEFRSLGHDLVDRIAGLLASMRARPVTPAQTPDEVRAALNATRRLPEDGASASVLLKCAADLLFDHSLFNGHPRFYGYITSSAAPIGMLAELLGAAVNANVGAWKLSPMATEIEAQTIRWLAQFIGYPPDCGGLFVSGGNMANFTCFLAARAAKSGWDARKQGVAAGPALLVYASRETHTWIQKAADITGLGTDAIRWIGVDERQRMDLAALEVQYSGILKKVAGHSSSSAPPEPSAQGPSIPCGIWRLSARSAISGSMWTAHTGRSPPGSGSASGTHGTYSGGFRGCGSAQMAVRAS